VLDSPVHFFLHLCDFLLAQRTTIVFTNPATDAIYTKHEQQVSQRKQYSPKRSKALATHPRETREHTGESSLDHLARNRTGR
jgi:hypothetical protein